MPESNMIRPGITKQKLIAELEALYEYEHAMDQADDLLLLYINDKDITEAYRHVNL